MSGIIKLHGTSGSGKTTVARMLMKRAVRTGVILGLKHPEAYQLEQAELRQPLFILGPYTATCGGMDSISDFDEHIRMLHEYAARGHVFYEGLLSSEYYGKLGKESERYGDNHVFAFMDTPIDLCIERVKARRLARGNTKPLNEDNTRGRIAKIARLKQKLDTELFRRTIYVPHDDPIPAILEVYREYDQSN